MSGDVAAILREDASELARRWADLITTCLDVDLSPYPSPEDPQLITGLGAYLDPASTPAAVLFQLSRRAREWGRLAELRGIDEEQVLDAYVILEDLLWNHLDSHGSADDPAALRGLHQGLMIVVRATIGAYRARHAERDRTTTDRLRAFSRMLSHEVKGPVSVISGAAELLTDPEQPGDERAQQKFLAIIRRNAAAIAQMVDDLLALSLAEGGADSVHGSCPLGEVVSLVLDSLSEDAARQGVRLQTEGRVPEVQVDRRSVQLVLANLVSNAIRYADSSRTERHVRVGFEPVGADGDWAVRVEDNGIGIPTAAQGRIFERFFRAHPSLPIAGTGLGLSIVHEMVEVWGGQIRVTSRPGEGSVFWFTIPGARESPPGPARQRPVSSDGWTPDAVAEAIEPQILQP